MMKVRHVLEKLWQFHPRWTAFQEMISSNSLAFLFLFSCFHIINSLDSINESSMGSQNNFSYNCFVQ